MSLTKAQQKALHAITQWVKRHQQAPTIRELAAALKLSSTGHISRVLQALAKEGFVKLGDGHRGLTLTQRTTGVPLVGEIPAGKPTFSDEYLEGYVDLPPTIGNHGGKIFALRIKGDSMVPTLLQGDIVYVRRAASALPRTIVVAHVNSEATVKRLKKKGETWWLEADNPKYEPMALRPPDGLIGVVLGSIRKF